MLFLHRFQLVSSFFAIFSLCFDQFEVICVRVYYTVFLLHDGNILIQTGKKVLAPGATELSTSVHLCVVQSNYMDDIHFKK